jgi:hypothetical protein
MLNNLQGLNIECILAVKNKMKRSIFGNDFYLWFFKINYINSKLTI